MVIECFIIFHLIYFSFDDELPMNQQAGKHFTLVSNIGCKSREIRVFETFNDYRNKTQILTNRCKKILKLLTKRKELTVRVVNVCPQDYNGKYTNYPTMYSCDIFRMRSFKYCSCRQHPVQASRNLSQIH